MKLMSPGSIHASDNGGSFESPVHPFDHAVGFRVVGRCMVTLRTKELVERIEGGTPVGGNAFGDPKPGDPCGEEGSGAGGR